MGLGLGKGRSLANKEGGGEATKWKGGSKTQPTRKGGRFRGGGTFQPTRVGSPSPLCLPVGAPPRPRGALQWHPPRPQRVSQMVPIGVFQEGGNNPPLGLFSRGGDDIKECVPHIIRSKS